ncbi:hypothetical protein SLEP1_g41403 [Rubroshorea leprosula]|uniref:Uncharacterized protein n=1 Tax=Rubroshorea leprosula TaxID=152421 RepID=A0AAV5L6X5_9ROSI|nr:hypothetical protein SLEP1_g41403 [Rubroshorea leprosula]
MAVEFPAELTEKEENVDRELCEMSKHQGRKTRGTGLHVQFFKLVGQRRRR